MVVRTYFLPFLVATTVTVSMACALIQSTGPLIMGAPASARNVEGDARAIRTEGRLIVAERTGLYCVSKR
jgi:hypothetical protein